MSCGSTRWCYSAVVKFNVSVPDNLWSEVLAQSTVGDSPSAVVQDALRRATVRISEPAELDEEAATMFEQARQHVRESAQAMYAKGYKAGLRLARDLDWETLRSITETGVVAAHAAEEQRYSTAFAASRLKDLKDTSPFVVDARRGETSGMTAGEGEDEDGKYDWFDDQDPHNYWKRGTNVQDDNNIVTVSRGDHSPLFILGTDAALRDVLAAATPN
jgi:hypothetical protein